MLFALAAWRRLPHRAYSGLARCSDTRLILSTRLLGSNLPPRVRLELGWPLAASFGTSPNRSNDQRDLKSSSISNSKPTSKPSIRENIYTIPNLLTVSRIIACPVLGWSILEGDFLLATSLLTYAGLTDWVSVVTLGVMGSTA